MLFDFKTVCAFALQVSTNSLDTPETWFVNIRMCG
jgi:hypothetical protein